MADDVKDNRVVLVVDEDSVWRGIEARLKQKRIPAVNLDPNEDFTAPTNQYNLRAVIYEPYFVTGDNVRFRPIVDEIIKRARRDNAQIIVFSSYRCEELEDDGFVQGVHYDKHFRKPDNPDKLLEGI